MPGPKGIRWPEKLEAEIKEASGMDDREFSKEVFYLLRLGLDERKEELARKAAYHQGLLDAEKERARRDVLGNDTTLESRSRAAGE